MFQNETKKQAWIGIFALYSLLVFFASSTFMARWHHTMMEPGLEGPYFSGAANLDSTFTWKVDIDEIKTFRSLDLAGQEAYKFQHAEQKNLVVFNHPYNSGLIYVIWFAKKLFFWMSDAQATRHFQLLVHLLLSLLLISVIKDFRMKCLFWVLFAVNPFFFRIALIPFYYFWQEIPSFWLAIRYFSKGRRADLLDSLSPLVFFISVFTRPTSLLICFFYYLYLFLQRRRLFSVVLLLVFCTLFISTKNKLQNYSQPWHTAYIGIGGYSNPHGILFKDASGFNKMLEKTGVSYPPPLSSNFDQDYAIYSYYMRVIKQEYIAIFKANPIMIFRNAIYNYLLSFSAGYYGNNNPLTWISAVMSLFVIALLVYSRAYFWLAAITLAGLTFTFYTPPTTGYLFGNYVLVFTGVLDVLFQNPSFLSVLQRRLRFFPSAIESQ